jgi:signal transduction histidine kinase
MSADEPVNILIVDDQPAKLLSLEVILRGLGENLLKASSGREALTQLLRNDVAVVLIDVVMPDLDGFELATMIRSHPRFQTTALIFVSAVALTDLDRLRGYEHGAVDYVPVPVIPDLLRAKVRVFAELYRKTTQLKLLNAELERRVEERTAELAQANAELEQRVAERTREREIALAQVHEMQKLESLGQLTGGVAHDFNNLLMAITGNLDLLGKKLQHDPGLERLVKGAMKSVERGAALTTRMLTFARRQELKPEAVDVAQLVKGMLDMLSRSLGPTIQIRMEIAGDLAPIRADPNQLELALLNLALNARDAMPGGGELIISARPEYLETATGGLRPGEYICIGVRDAGTGMDEATLRRAAEPFFTTKGLGKGTGLGLSMVNGLAAQSGGDARISSALGVGTTVELRLPVVETEATDRPLTANRSVSTAVQPCTVLVVDDDPDVAESTANLLIDLGHAVLVAPSGAAAMDILCSDAAIDVVITDYAMPGMTGVQLASHIRETKPHLPIIIATGYADLAGGDKSGVEIPGVLQLAKPYRQAELDELLRRVLERQAAVNLIPIMAAKIA